MRRELIGIGIELVRDVAQIFALNGNRSLSGRDTTGSSPLAVDVAVPTGVDVFGELDPRVSLGASALMPLRIGVDALAELLPLDRDSTRASKALGDYRRQYNQCRVPVDMHDSNVTMS
jgi:hypothetical protein